MAMNKPESQDRYASNRLSDDVKNAERSWMTDADYSRLVVFTHVPKTGGTSMKQIITINYGRHYADHHPRIQNLIDEVESGSRNPDDVLAISSHLPYGIHSKIPGFEDRTVLPITVVRDPLKRLISYYNFVTTFKPHRLHSETKDLDINEFFELGFKDGWGEISDGQCRIVSGGSSKADEAISKLEAEYFAYAALEDNDALITTVGELLGWPDLNDKSLVANQSPKKRSWDDLTPAVAERLTDANAEDIALYTYVKDAGPVVRKDLLESPEATT